MDPRDSQFLYATGPQGGFTTSDGAKTWHPMGSGGAGTPPVGAGAVGGTRTGGVLSLPPCLAKTVAPTTATATATTAAEAMPLRLKKKALIRSVVASPKPEYGERPANGMLGRPSSSSRPRAGLSPRPGPVG